jgi:hypothetical protein
MEPNSPPQIRPAKPLVRWTVGPTTRDGLDCLSRSVAAFLRLYDADVAICHNCPADNLADLVARFPLVDQHAHLASVPVPPAGVAWKLYPPRLAVHRHELVIDNDLIVERAVPEIDRFLAGDCTLLLAEASRTYGRFERHVPPGYAINSGLYGMPPGFDLGRHVAFHCGPAWEENATGTHALNRTFDEQGLVASALLSYPRFVIIPASCVTNCEHRLVDGHGHHFVGLNRREYHGPYKLYKCRTTKLFL